MSLSESLNRSFGLSSKVKATSASHSSDSAGFSSRWICIQSPLPLISRFAAANGVARLGFSRARPLGFPLVVHFLAARQGQLALDPAAFEVNLGGDQRKALLACLA